MILDTIIQSLGTGKSIFAGYTVGKPISLEDYKSWQKQYTFEALKGAKYGASFCNHFGILDYRILFDSTPESCDNIIRKEWIARA